MPDRRGRVVALVLDGFGPEFARAELTPNLLRLAEDGALAQAGGLTDLVASTGPGHASLLTGARSTRHGLIANRLLDERGLPADAVSVQVTTIIDRARAAGCSTAIAVSDSDILNTVHGARSDRCWPSADQVRHLADLLTGHVSDERTLQTLVGLVDDGVDLFVGQLQETDTAAHADGIDGERARAAERAADGAVGTLVEALRRDWERTLLLVVSDHRAENVVSQEPVQLAATLEGLATVVEDGSATLIRPCQAELAQVLHLALACPGIAAVTPTDSPYLVAWAEPGRAFGCDSPILTRSTHGNLTTRPCLTLLSGGHPLVARVTPSIRLSPPLVIAEADLQRAFAILDECFSVVERDGPDAPIDRARTLC